MIAPISLYLPDKTFDGVITYLEDNKKALISIIVFYLRLDIDHELIGPCRKYTTTFCFYGSDLFHSEKAANKLFDELKIKDAKFFV